jgi:hypothetical protein
MHGAIPQFPTHLHIVVLINHRFNFTRISLLPIGHCFALCVLLLKSCQRFTEWVDVAVTLDLCLESAQFSRDTSSPDQGFHALTLSLQANVGIVPKLSHSHFLPNPLLNHSTIRLSVGQILTP